MGVTRRAAAVLGLAITCALVAASPALAAPCPSEGAEVLELEAVPPVTANDVIEIFISNAKHDAGLVSRLVITVDGMPNDTVAAPRTRGSFLLVADGLRPGTHTIGITWSQTATGGVAACEGSDARPLRVYDAGADLGDPSGPHLAGRWRLRVTAIDFRQKAATRAWTLTPTCVDGACDTKLKSSLGLSATLVWTGDRYEWQRQGSRPEKGVGCLIGSKRIPNAFLLYNEITIRITKRSATGAAVDFSGRQRRTYEPTAAASSQGCSTPIVQTTRLVGHRI
jgi:hypothetical protein